MTGLEKAAKAYRDAVERSELAATERLRISIAVNRGEMDAQALRDADNGYAVLREEEDAARNTFLAAGLTFER